MEPSHPKKTVAALAGTALLLLTSCGTPQVQGETLSPAPSREAVLVTCGSGFGTSTESGTTAQREHPIWSEAWKKGSLNHAPDLVLADGSKWVSLKSATTVTAETSGSVAITHPATARLVLSSAEEWGNSTETPIDSAKAATKIDVPNCATTDTYPGLILMPEPGCVTLEIHPKNEETYEVSVSVGGQTLCG